MLSGANTRSWNIRDYMRSFPGAGQNRSKLRKDIEEYHIAYGIDFDDMNIDTFIAGRPDGLAFDKENKLCVFLEYTRAMHTNEDWAEKKEQEKND